MQHITMYSNAFRAHPGSSGHARGSQRNSSDVTITVISRRPCLGTKTRGCSVPSGKAMQHVHEPPRHVPSEFFAQFSTNVRAPTDTYIRSFGGLVSLQYLFLHSSDSFKGKAFHSYVIFNRSWDQAPITRRGINCIECYGFGKEDQVVSFSRVRNSFQIQHLVQNPPWL